jgi:hypothetical protein
MVSSFDCAIYFYYIMKTDKLVLNCCYDQMGNMGNPTVNLLNYDIQAAAVLDSALSAHWRRHVLTLASAAI